MEVGALRFSAPATTRTRHRAQTPTPPHEFPSGAPARRATSRSVSSLRAEACSASGVNDTSLDEVFTANWHLRTKLSSVFCVYISMRTQSKMNDETRIAEQIVSVLPAGVARACSPEKHTIRYAVRAEGLKLKTIVFNRASLRRLAADPARGIKIEYLQRDLEESASRRSEFRYPRLHIHATPVLPSRFHFGFPIASVL
jgi:hypothetical protein